MSPIRWGVGGLVCAAALIAAALVAPSRSVAASASASASVDTSAPGRVTFAFGGPGGSRPRVGGDVGGYFDAIALAGGDVVVAGEAPGRRVGLLDLTPAGRPRSSFGQGGVVYLAAGSSYVGGVNLVPGPGGTIVVVADDGQIGDSSLQVPEVTRLLPDGTLDSSFGNGGTVVVAHFGVDCLEQCAVTGPGGTLILVGAVPTTATKSGSEMGAARLTAAGALDPGFGRNGVGVVQGGTEAYKGAVTSDGSVALAGAGARRAVLAWLTAAGQPATRSAAIQIPDDEPALLAQPDGSVLVASGIDSGRYVEVSRYTAAEGRDRAYGNAGGARVPDLSVLLPSPSGGVRVAAVESGPPTLRVWSLTADGQPDGAEGGAGGLSARLHFGGGATSELETGRLQQDSVGFEGSALALARPDGSIVVVGGVELDAVLGMGVARSVSRLAVAAFGPGLGTLRTFGGADPLSVSVALPRQALAPGAGRRCDYSTDHHHHLRCLYVDVRSSQAALAQVVVSVGATVLARGLVCLFRSGPHRAQVLLTRAGGRMIGPRTDERVAVTVKARDVAGNEAGATASLRLAG